MSSIPSEYGASTPANIPLETARWMKHHPLWPVLYPVLAGTCLLLMLWGPSGFLWLALLFAFLTFRYWGKVRHAFRHGNANPARLLSVRPPLVAVWSDLTTSEEQGHPAIKVLPYPLKTVLGQPLQVGQAVPTASIYQGSEDAEAWKDLTVYLLEEGSADHAALGEMLGRIPPEEWAELDGALEAAGWQMKPGLHRLS